MSRIRSVHPGLWTDEAFVCLSDAAQIFFIGLWTECDDQGAFEWKPIQLRLKLRGNRDGSVDPILAELEAANCIRSYEHNGRKYGLVRNFAKFQRPKKPNAIHFIPAEFRTFIGSEAPSSETVGNQFPTGGEKSPQMEDEGGRREDEGGEREVARAPEIPPHKEEAKAILADHGDELSDWEDDFLRGIVEKGAVSAKQIDSLNAIKAKLTPKTAKPYALPSVKRGTPAYDAWIAYYRRRGKAGFYEKLDAITVPTEFPPEEKAA